MRKKPLGNQFDIWFMIKSTKNVMKVQWVMENSNKKKDLQDSKSLSPIEAFPLKIVLKKELQLIRKEVWKVPLGLVKLIVKKVNKTRKITVSEITLNIHKIWVIKIIQKDN